ncbi:MAG TPA: sigma-70 family RNA polymerase sigma factor [Puia sp.]
MTNYQNDIELLSAFQRNEVAAENLIFKKYFRPLCLYAERITGHLHQSEDIVTEVFLKALTKRAEFQSLDNLRAFLYKAIRNAGMNYNIAVKGHNAAHQEIGYLARDNYYEAGDFFQNEILMMELVHEIYKEIENLPPQCGKIFKLLFIKGLTTDEIAQMLSINVQTVRTQKARAIQLIKIQLLKANKFFPLLFLFFSVVAPADDFKLK